MRTLTVVGLGYMGLPTALLLARSGRWQVVGCDIAEARVATLERGELPFNESGLRELFDEARERFRATTTLEPSDLFILALPTPADARHHCDVSALEGAIGSLAQVVRDGDVVVVESTVSPGTTARLRARLRADSGKAVHFAYVAEKAIPGNTLTEMVHNDRVIGVIDPEAHALTTEVYQSFVRGALFHTDATTAEAVKLFENTFRDVNIALANELADLAEAHRIDVHEAIALANRHPRVNILSPGPGVGGHCIAVDPWFLVQDVTPGALVRTSRGINDARPEVVAARVARHAPVGARIAVLGAAYKANVDDARESPSLAVAERLRARGFVVGIHDPHVRMAGVTADLDEVLSGTACIVLATDHAAYATLDLDRVAPPPTVVIDTRGLWRERGWAPDRYVLLGGRVRTR